MKITNLLIVLSIAALMGAGCSKSENVIPDLTVPENPTISTFEVNGSYMTDCIEYPFGGMRTVSVVSDQTGITLETKYYKGLTCAEVTSTETIKGSLQELGATNGVQLVKMIIPINENVSTWRFYNMKFDGDSLLISESFGQKEDADQYSLSLELFLMDENDAEKSN